MNWCNADEITQHGMYLWRHDARPVPRVDDTWLVEVHFRSAGPPKIELAAGLAYINLEGARGRFLGPIPNDSGDGT